MACLLSKIYQESTHGIRLCLSSAKQTGNLAVNFLSMPMFISSVKTINTIINIVCKIEKPTE
jgi:hypothetical protein